jgi:2-polyprenyl-3-methyl-5-hydroxy-6-metoxy-1,4-benzoquinol methylase
MQLLYYSSGVDENARRLKAAVQKVIPAGRIEHFSKLDDFRDRLRTIVEPDSVAVLSAPNRGELQKMQLFRKLLTEIYVILVLPDRGKGTIALAHLLLPRFLSQKDSDFADLKVVLNRMYDNSQKSQDLGSDRGVLT